MLRLLKQKRPWFRAKRHGYGTGLPIAWEGWLFLTLHIATIAGLAVLLQGRSIAMTVAAVLAGLAPMPLYRARTEGGWRWR